MTHHDSKRLRCSVVLKANSLTEFIYSHRTSAAPVIVYKNAGKDLQTLSNVTGLLGASQPTRAFKEVREIRYDPEATKSIAMGLHAHPMHLDGCFSKLAPSKFLLQSVVADPAAGGESLFLDLLPLLDKISPDYLQALLTQPVVYERFDDEGFVDSFQGLVLRNEGGSLRFRWRYDDQVKPVPVDKTDCSLISEAIQWLASQIQEQPVARYMMEPGDIVSIDNTTTLHGRTALARLSDRHIRRVWLA